MNSTDNRRNLTFEFRYNVCRGCLIVSSVAFSPIDDSILNSFTELSGINVSNGSSLPHRLCNGCLRAIKQSNRFKSTCLNSNRILTELLQSSLTYTGQFDLNDLRRERRKYIDTTNPLTFSKTMTIICPESLATCPPQETDTFTDTVKNSPQQTPPDSFAGFDLRDDVPLNIIGRAQGKILDNSFIDYDGVKFLNNFNNSCPESVFDEVSNKFFVVDSKSLEDSLKNQSNLEDLNHFKRATTVKNEFNNSLYVEVTKDDDEDRNYDDFDARSASPNIKEEELFEVPEKATPKIKKKSKKKKKVSDSDDEEYTLEPSSFKRKRSAVLRYESGAKSGKLKKQKSKTPKLKKHTELKKDPAEMVRKRSLQIYHFDEESVSVQKLTVEEQFQDLAEAKKTKQYIDAPFKCDDCAKYFSYELTWQGHMVRHEESAGQYMCKICKQRYSTPRSLQCHSAIHDERLQCKHCLKVLSGRSHMAKHVAKHKGLSQTFECDICGSTSTSKSNYKRHMTIHTSEPKKHKCPYCPRAFNHSANRNDHIIRAHTGQKQFACEVCNVAFVNKTALKAHSIKHSERKDFYCVECDKSYKTRFSLAHHLNVSSKHGNPAYLKFHCTQCDKRYDTARKLKLHIDCTHLHIFKWACEKCSARFRSPGGLRHHRDRVHEGKVSLKNQMCDTCGRSFSSKYKLKIHHRTHTSDRPYILD